MKSATNKRAKRSSKTTRRARTSKPASASAIIRQTGNNWAQHWNSGDLDSLVATYAPDAVYLPPHHVAVHGREAIREYLKGPLSHGVNDLAFEVTYIKQDANVAWDVGTYHMSIPASDGARKADHGKYLTIWKRAGTKWVIAADAWSSDLPPSH